MLRDPSLHPLSHQHQHGLALSVIIRRTLDREESEKTRRELAAKVKAAWELELEGHFAVEEQTLFPAVKGRIEEPLLVDRLVAEHREMESMVREIVANPEAPRLRAFAKLLNDHIRSEERQLFEQVQGHLNAEELAALGRRLEGRLAKVCPAVAGLPWERA